MGIRKRKNLLIDVLKFRAMTCGIRPEEAARFESMYRRARTIEEQDQVTDVIKSFVHGWKDSDDHYSRLLRAASDLDDFLDEDADHLPASLEAAIRRTSVNLSDD